MLEHPVSDAAAPGLTVLEDVDTAAFPEDLTLHCWVSGTLDALSELVQDSSDFLRELLPDEDSRLDLHAGDAVTVALSGLVVPAMPLAGSLPVWAGGGLSGNRVSLITALFLLLGAYAIHRRQEDGLTGGFSCRLLVALLLASMGVHAAFAVLDGCGLFLGCVGVQPFVVLWHLQELFSSPMWLISLNQRRQVPLRDTIPTLVSATLGLGGQLTAAVVTLPSLQWCVLGFGALCLGVSTSQVMERSLPPQSVAYRGTLPQPHPLSAKTDSRLQRCASALALHWLLGGLIQGLGLAHAVDERQQMLEFALLDLVVKLGGCHILTKGDDAEPEPEQ